MKVGNIVSGLEVVDVKRVNKLNLIQFLKEVDSYLQQGYKLDVNSARQVGLVLQVDLFKTESAFDLYKTEVSSSPKVGTTGVKEEEVKTVVSPKAEQEKEVPVEDTAADSTPVETVKKPTTTRSKKTTQ